MCLNKITPFVNPMELDIHKLNRGDLLQFVPIKRFFYYKHHWALYVGLRPYCGKEDVPCIVHSVSPKNRDWFRVKEHDIVMESIENIISEKKEKYNVRVNNVFDEKVSPIRDNDHIVWRALCDISDKDVRYLQLNHEKTLNCKNFEEIVFGDLFPMSSEIHVKKWCKGIKPVKYFPMHEIMFFSICGGFVAFSATDKYKSSPQEMYALYKMYFDTIKFIYIVWCYT